MIDGMIMKHLSGDECGMNCGHEFDQVCDGDESVEVLRVGA